MALIIPNTYPLSQFDIYECTYWRVVRADIDGDLHTGSITVYGYKSKQFRIDNGAAAFFPAATTTVRVQANNPIWQADILNMNVFEFAYGAIKLSKYDRENWDGPVFSQAQDDLPVQE